MEFLFIILGCLILIGFVTLIKKKFNINPSKRCSSEEDDYLERKIKKDE